jgi:transposase
MSGERKKYDRESKEQALKMLKESGKNVHEIETDLGIGMGCLYCWKRGMASGRKEAFPGNGNLKQSEKETAELRKELEITRQERDILKKALGILSRGLK